MSSRSGAKRKALQLQLVLHEGCSLKDQGLPSSLLVASRCWSLFDERAVDLRRHSNQKASGRLDVDRDLLHAAMAANANNRTVHVSVAGYMRDVLHQQFIIAIRGLGLDPLDYIRTGAEIDSLVMSMISIFWNILIVFTRRFLGIFTGTTVLKTLPTFHKG